jgi:hypothetical protein
MEGQGTGAKGFVFEEVMGQMLGTLKHSFESEGFLVTIRSEQQIRDHFNEQSLNGVDHMIELSRGTEKYCGFFPREMEVNHQSTGSQSVFGLLRTYSWTNARVSRNSISSMGNTNCTHRQWGKNIGRRGCPCCPMLNFHEHVSVECWFVFL